MQQLRAVINARDLDLAAAANAAGDERRAAASLEARLAAMQAALQQRESDCQDRQTTLRCQVPWLRTTPQLGMCFCVIV